MRDRLVLTSATSGLNVDIARDLRALGARATPASVGRVRAIAAL